MDNRDGGVTTNRGVVTNRGDSTDQEVEALGGQVLTPEDMLGQEDLFDNESEEGQERQEALLAGSFGDDDPAREDS